MNELLLHYEVLSVDNSFFSAFDAVGLVIGKASRV